jgi:hypothetical protein
MTAIGIIGARKYKDRQSVIDLVDTLPSDCEVITSSCKGVCAWAIEAAKARGLAVKIFSPDLTDIRNRIDMVERYYQRNRELVAACDIVHAFISKENGLSGGTKYEVRYARGMGKKMILHWEKGDIQRIDQRTLPFGGKEMVFAAAWMKFFSDTLA